MTGETGANMSAKKQNLRKMCVHVHERDKIRLELIRFGHGVSMSAAIRAGIRMVAQKLGVEKDMPDETLEKI